MEAIAILAGRWNREDKMFISFCVIDTILLVRSHSIDEIVSEIRLEKASRLTFFWDDPWNCAQCRCKFAGFMTLLANDTGTGNSSTF